MKSTVSRATIVLVLTFSCVPVLGRSSKSPQPSQDEQTSAPSADQGRKLDIILALDNSGSMKANDPERLTKQVVTKFLASLGPTTRLGIVIFDASARLVMPLGEVTAGQAKESFAASLSQIDYSGKLTDSPSGIERALYELKSNGRDGATKIIILLTDGIVDTGDKTKDQEQEAWLKQELAADAAENDVHIFGIAFTDEADFSLIQTLANKTDGEYFRAFQASDIDGVFQEINESIKTREDAATAVATSQIRSMHPQENEQGLSMGVTIAIVAGILGLVALTVFLLRGSSQSPRPQTSHDRSEGRFEPTQPLLRAELCDPQRTLLEQPLSITRAVISIGREAHNDVVIPEETVSADHAIIRFKGDHYVLEDLRSSNGTFLNDQQLEPDKPIRLKNGDLIRLDIFDLVFSLPDQTPAGKTRLAGAPEPAPSKKTMLRTNPASREEPTPPTESAPRRDEPSSTQPEQSTPEPSSATEESPATPSDVAASQDEEPSSPSENIAVPTVLKPGMCPQHASRRATELCIACKKVYCKECVSEIDGKTICHTCAAPGDVTA